MRVTSLSWTEAEMQILRDVYPEHGVKECARLLPKRAEGSIVMRASQFKIRRLPGTIRRPGSGRHPRGVPRTAPRPKAERPAKLITPSPAARVAPVPAPAPVAPPAPKHNCEVVKAADLRPGMIVNRYPVGTSAAPALREVTEARFSDSGARVFFNLSWRQTKLPNGKVEMPAASWDFYRNPELAFEVYPALDALDRKVRR